jgi:hypothetical protein
MEWSKSIANLILRGRYGYALIEINFRAKYGGISTIRLMLRIEDPDLALERKERNSPRHRQSASEMANGTVR